MISLNDILERAAVRLSTDAALQAWCQEQFGKAPVIFVGMDEKNRPGQSECPCIVLRPAQIADGDEEEEFDYAMQVNWVIANERTTTAAGVTRYSGIAQREAMGNLIYSCLRGISENVAVSSREVIYDDGSQFPMWEAASFCYLKVPHLLGAEIAL